MAETRLEKKPQPRGLEPKKPLSSGGMSKAERFKRPEVSLKGKPDSGPTNKPTDVDLFAKEKQYKLMNAELEAKTADVVRQAEQIMREHSEVFSRPISTHLTYDIEDEEDDSRIMSSEQPTTQDRTTQDRGVKVVTHKKGTSTSVSRNTHTGKQRKDQQVSFKTATPKLDEDMAAVDDFSLVMRSMEEKLNYPSSHDFFVDYVPSAGDNGGSDADVCILKANLRILQEELERISDECNKKDDENTKLSTKIKEVEEDRARLQKTTNVQQTQIEKQATFAEESARKCDGLQKQVAGLQKELDGLNRSYKQAVGNHSSVEVRLNRALEEVERLKTQLNKITQMNKDKISEEYRNKENLLAENKVLKKQKAELVVGFKKQLKLIDILKRQKMHFEAAKLLSFTEEEFMTALDWGKS